ncbi:peripheral myelin protein 22-like [Scyliorhinus torazame]|uniref:peripheral myelin protein 22-like n=1 Tax=Scyliorhinus torazame TaxID=75743 RepID=UPI003B5BF064
MYLLLPTLLLLHLICLVLIYTSTIDNSWWIYTEGKTRDLWKQCDYINVNQAWICSAIDSSRGQEWLQASQASMVLAVLFSSASFFIFLCQLFTLRNGSLFYATGLFQIFAGLCVMTGALIFTLHVEEMHEDLSGNYGYSYILAWVSFPITLGSGVMYIHLRKLQ